MFSNDRDGNKISGNKEELVDAVLKGAFVKVSALGPYRIFYSTQTTFVIDGDVCTQAAIDLGRSTIHTLFVSIL